MPWVRAWQERFPAKNFAVIGVHTPETADERQTANVAKHSKRLGVHHAVAIDTDCRNWRAYGVRMWPTVVLIDKRGIIRYRFEGELGWWAKTRGVSFEKLIGELIAEPM